MPTHTAVRIGVIVAVLLATCSFFSPRVSAGQPTTGSAPPKEGIVAFYFHGNVRCATCRKIEAYTDEAIRTGFAEALDNGTLTWIVINVDQPMNEHFIEDFELVTRSVVLVEYRDGEVVRWKNLEKVWQLVRSEDRFVEYIQGETREFLGEG